MTAYIAASGNAFLLEGGSVAVCGMTVDWLYRCDFITCIPDAINLPTKGTTQ